MSLSVAQLIAEVSVTGVAQAEANLIRMALAADGAGAKLKILALGSAAILVGVGVAATKMAGDFQAGMTSLVTGAGESQSNLKAVSAGILNMAVQTGTSTKQLTDGMYMIESAGFHGAAGLDVLKAAAEGAKVGNADLGTVANGVTTIMVDYAKSHITAAQATNILVATTASGKVHMQDLAASLSAVLPTSAAVGVGMKDVAGAMATMTGEGVPAANAATYLRQMLVALETPGSKAVSTLKSIGLSSSEVSDEMKKSLPGALQLITDHLKQKFPEGSAAYVEALKNIAGGSRQMQGMLDLTGDHLKTFQGNVAGITGAMNKGGNSILGWTLVQGEFNFKLAQAKEVLETFLIKIGTLLLPIATAALNLFVLLSPAILGVVDALSSLGQEIEVVIVPLFGFSRTLIADAASHFTDLADTLKNPVHDALDNTRSILHKDVIPEFQSLADLVSGKVHQSFIEFSPVALALAHTMQNDLAVSTGIAGKALQATGDWIMTTGIPEYTSFASVVKDKLGAAYLQLAKDAQGIGGAIGGKIGGAVGGALPKLDLGSLFGGADLSSIKLSLKEISVDLGGIARAFKGVGSTVQGVWSFLKPIFDVWGEWGTRIKNDWSQNLPIIQDELLQFWTHVKPGLQDLIDHLKQIPGLGQLFANIDLNKFNLKDFIANWQHIVDLVIDNFFKKLPVLLGDVLGPAEFFFDTAIRLATGFFDVLQPVFNLLNAVGVWMSGPGAKALGTFADGVANLGNDFQNVAGWIANMANQLQNVSNILANSPVLGGLIQFFQGASGSNPQIGNPGIYGGGIGGGGSHNGGVGGIGGGRGFAGGTDFAPGGWSWVGEEGPEKMYVPHGAQIYPHSQSMQMAQGGGYSGPREVILQVGSYQLGRVIMPLIADQKRMALGVRM